MGGGTSLASQQQLAQQALAPQQSPTDQSQQQYFALMNQLTQQQIAQGQQQPVGIPLMGQSQFGSLGGSGFGSTGYSPQSVDPWSYGGGGFGYG